ncbi:hypothetical protein LCGC14_0523190 [marine sediment metagenome]|uniref:Uncharacterized protein n=1 Tax=marine sediment metagenome TaxID=412755 RepID=A0A0F9V657_9ZZZZ
MTNLFTQDDCKLIMTTMMNQMKHLSAEERIKVGMLCNKMKPIAEGKEIFEVLSVDQANELIQAAQPSEPDLYESFEDLLDNIAQHNIATEGIVTIIPADDVLRFTLGWVCIETERVWKIKIMNLKKWPGTFNNEKKDESAMPPDNRMDLMKRANVSMEGKMALAAALSNLGKD